MLQSHLPEKTSFHFFYLEDKGNMFLKFVNVPYGYQENHMGTVLAWNTAQMISLHPLPFPINAAEVIGSIFCDSQGLNNVWDHTFCYVSGRGATPTSPKIKESNAVGRDQSQWEDSFLLKYRDSFGSYTRKVLSMFIHSSSAWKYFVVSWDKFIPEPQAPLTWRSMMIFPLTLTAVEIEQHLTPLKTSHLKEKKCCSFKEEYETFFKYRDKKQKDFNTEAKERFIKAIPFSKGLSLH